jgi:hypothetical protein
LRELATALDVSEEGLKRLIDLAVQIGLFTRTGYGLRNNGPSSLLRSDRTPSMRSDARHILASWSRIAWDQLAFAVRTGTAGFEEATGMPVFRYLQLHPDDSSAFHDFQAKATLRNSRALLSGCDLPQSGNVIDVGGGNGALMAEILRHRPKLRGCLFDLPEVIAAARTAPLTTAFGTRLTLTEGDFFTAVPRDGDLYLLSHVLHDWSDEKASQILRRVADAMAVGSRLLVLENVKPVGEPGLLISYLDLLMLVAWGGRERTEDQYRILLRGACPDADIEPRLLDAESGLTAITVTKHARHP